MKGLSKSKYTQFCPPVPFEILRIRHLRDGESLGTKSITEKSIGIV